MKTEKPRQYCGEEMEEVDDVVVDTITPSKAMMDAAKPIFEYREADKAIAKKAKDEMMALMRKEGSAKRKFWILVEEETGSDASMRLVTNNQGTCLENIEVIE